MSIQKRRTRKPLRLKNYDYTRPGAYFVTICTRQKIQFFALPEHAAIVSDVWGKLPEHFPTIELDEFVVMPNHVHFIVWLTESEAGAASNADANVVGASLNEAPTATRTFRRPRFDKHRPELGEVVRRFKAVVTRRLRKSGEAGFRWQRNYYEHIIRDERALNAIRQYIRDNPQRWHLDRYNPRAAGEDPQARTLWKLLQSAPLPQGRD
jgi:REP element-mobilizing transposase RayT